MIRIVLVDDQTLVRQGIRSLLQLAPGVSIVAEASDGEEAVAVISARSRTLCCSISGCRRRAAWMF